VAGTLIGAWRGYVGRVVTTVDLLAREVGVTGPTLRRAVARGLVRAERLGPRGLVLPAGETTYVRRHWPLFSALVDALRTHPNVRLAVVYGSVARGRQRAESDLDLLVLLRIDTPAKRAALVDALAAVAGIRVQLVSVTQAEEAPLLLADVIRDGRVLVDRDGDWARLQQRREQIVDAARVDDLRLDELAWTAPEALGRLRDGSGVCAG
jgi:predicted nucleotidyltransferase